MSHTPGPWKATPIGSEGTKITTSHETLREAMAVGGPSIAMVASRKDVEQWKANARLIAAAPELLDALIAMREHAEHSTTQGATAFQKAEAAIAKATGDAK